MTLKQLARQWRVERKREMGDHRRWMWAARQAWLQGGLLVIWHPVHGRLYLYADSRVPVETSVKVLTAALGDEP